jgi:probable HAF family extracellular repeat protein
LYLASACSINTAGEIVGFAFDNSGNVHAYLAVPNDANHT